MNFDYLQTFPDLKKLYEYCAEAEEFVLYKPSVSAASARKAIEYIVKMIYTSLVGEAEANRTVFEITQDVRAFIVPDGVLFGPPRLTRPSVRSWWRTSAWRRSSPCPPACLSPTPPWSTRPPARFLPSSANWRRRFRRSWRNWRG